MDKIDMAIMLRALLLMDAKFDKFDELMPDSMSEYLGSELWALRTVLFHAIGFPEDTFETVGYDDEESFCDDRLHDILSDWKYLVNTEDYISADDCSRLDSRYDTTLDIFVEKIGELEIMRDEFMSKRNDETN